MDSYAAATAAASDKLVNVVPRLRTCPRLDPNNTAGESGATSSPLVTITSSGDLLSPGTGISDFDLDEDQTHHRHQNPSGNLPIPRTGTPDIDLIVDQTHHGYKIPSGATSTSTSTADVQSRAENAGIGNQSSADAKEVHANLSFRSETITRTTFVCTYKYGQRCCGKRFARIYDLRRHHRGAHEGVRTFLCRFQGCDRGRKGFSRKDKRDDHEKKIHFRRVVDV